MNTLTEPQARIVLAIQDSNRKRGFSPSIKELCEVTGLRSTSSVHWVLKRLEYKGVIRRVPNTARAIRVLIDEVHVDGSFPSPPD